MTDRITKKQRSAAMAAVKGAGNQSTEIALAKIFRKFKIKGWRRGNSKIIGKPDFVFLKKKIAIFVDGCFWHGCKRHGSIPKTNGRFWSRKILRNKERDKFVNRTLRKSGWNVIRLWEHSVETLDKSKIVRILENKF
jgi:DNA mismatch endonuclease (patch repair protein)